MKVVESVAELAEIRRGRRPGTTGFVPTMGALHAGHLSLLERARTENDSAWSSIFVNPAQFNEPRDLASYPRPLEDDLEKLRAAGCDLVFMPRAEEIYRDGYRYRVTENERSLELEGAARPGHFDGMLTVVLKLLILARPDRAYFGEKDYQQFRLVEGMARAFFLETEIIPCRLVREPDGLAMSSRNRLLAPADRRRAPDFHRLLAASIAAGQSADDASRALEQAGFDVEYVADREGRRLAAVRLGQVRLIDNVE